MKIHKADLSHEFLLPLKEIPAPPQTLWLQGALPTGERPKVVSIVGSRKNTKYGEEVAYKLAYDLARRGVIVVSGLAYGIDSCAHRGCLDGGGITIAVLGTSIDHIYPASNLNLAKKILERGAIISEYGIGESTREWSFVERNRIVSGLADAVVIVEAAARSGTSITAAHALEQGRDVFAVPGDITRPTSVGCNRLIKQGAMPFTEAEDILGVLFPSHAKQLKFEIFGDTANEQKIIDALKNGLRDGDKIIETLKFPVSEFNQTITLMEIKGMIRSLGANHWALV
ncbi:DNA-processing protein DprA [Candidatus Saccharibacteria bacterium]|nr:DNA-processing protein DprA [Candidatus Saccharibacteria bacterium]